MSAGTCSRGDQSSIAQAIGAVARGELILGPSLARRAAAYFGATAQSARPAEAPRSGFGQLTTREQEVLELLAAGRTNAQIAAALHLSPKTVRNNVSAVFATLQVASRAEAISQAREAGLGR